MNSGFPAFFGGLAILPVIWTATRPAERQLLVRGLLRFWPVLRPIAGWFFIALGVLGIILPVLQGVLFLVLGASLIGRRHVAVRLARVRYKQLLRRWSRSPNRLRRWLGIRGLRALRALTAKIVGLRASATRRAMVRRRFRLALVPAQPACQALDRWRARYDPAYGYRLPPHIVLVAASRSRGRPAYEQAVAAVCATFETFAVTLDTLVCSEDEHRIVAVVGGGPGDPRGGGSAPIAALRAALAAVAPGEIRFSERRAWPCLTLGKIRLAGSLRSAYAYVSAHWSAQTWRASELVLFEERLGHMWHEVRRFPFGHRIRGNEASLLIEEVP